MRFTKGFKYEGKQYGWYGNQLYRLPYCSKQRWYALLKCKPCLINNRRKGFILGNKRKSRAQLDAITGDIDITVKVYEDDGMPF